MEEHQRSIGKTRSAVKVNQAVTSAPRYRSGNGNQIVKAKRSLVKPFSRLNPPSLPHFSQLQHDITKRRNEALVGGTNSRPGNHNTRSTIPHQTVHPQLSFHLDRDLVEQEADAFAGAEEVGNHGDGGGADDIGDHVDTPAPNQRPPSSAGSCASRRTRGPTTGMKYSKRSELGEEEAALQIPEDLQRIVGARAQEFITKSGRYVRHHAPLNVEKWAHIQQDIIDTMIDRVFVEFKLPNEPHVLGGIEKALRRHFNIWRNNLHTHHYKKWNTDAQRRAHCPEGIDPEKWNWLIGYWGSPKFKRISDICRKNRSQQKIPARVGTKSIARTLYQMRQSPSEDLPEYIRLWEKSRKGAKAQWINEEAEEVYHKLKDLHDKEVSEKGEDTLTTQEAYTLVLGHKSGYVRGMGAGPQPLARGQLLRAQIRAELEAEMSSKIQREVEQVVSQRNAEAEERLSQREARLEKMEAQMLAFMNRIPEVELMDTN